MPGVRPTFDDAAAFLADGPRAEEDLLEAVGLGDEDDTWYEADELLDDPRLVELGEGRVGLVAQLLDGLVAWHRVSADELDRRTLVLGIDTAVYEGILTHPWEVTVGDEVVTVVAGLADPADPVPSLTTTLPLPDGWAMDLAAGDLVGLVHDGRGIHLLPASEVAGDGTGLGDRAPQLLADALAVVADERADLLSLLCERDASAEGSWVLDLPEVAAQLVADHRPVVRDLGLPLGEALDRAGLQHRNGVVGGPAVHESALGLYVLGREVVRSSPIDRALGEEVEAAGLAWAVLTGGEGPDGDVESADEEVLAALEVPRAVDGIVTRLPDLADDRVAAVRRRAQRLHDRAPGAVGPAWVFAEADLAAGAPRGALDALSRTLAPDDEVPDEVIGWSSAWEALALLRAISGDVEGAIALYRLIRDDGIARRLEQWRPAAPAGVGRNERCPCGSGRKFKQCCLVRPRPLDLDGRVRFLWWKLETWVTRAHGHSVPRPDIDEVPASDLGAVLALGSDAHLVEDGALGEAVEHIGDLLPDDERGLVSRWTPERRLWGVVSTDRTGGAVLRDQLDGDEATVRAHGLVKVPVGMLLLSVVVPGANERHVVGHAVRVAPHHRDRAVAVLASGPSGQDIVDLAVILARAG